MDLCKAILDEITLYCRDECCSSQECPEDECILFKIERMVVESESMYQGDSGESDRGLKHSRGRTYV